MNKSDDSFNSDFNSLQFNAFTETDVNETIKNLKHGKSPGFDMITSELLKTIAQTVIKPLTYLINLSFKQGIFQKIYEQSVVVPILKAGDVTNVSNYCPIALISTMSKIFELLG